MYTNIPHSKTTSFSSLFVKFFVIASVLAVIHACEDPGTVGNQFADLEPNLVTDTLDIQSFDHIQVNASSGNKRFITAGLYTDPVFGRYNAKAMIQPLLGASLGPEGDSLSTNLDSTQITLDLRFNPGNIWGDTTSTVRFKLVEINEAWQQNEWKYKDTVSLGDNLIAEFDYQKEDSLTVPLSQEWTARFVDIFNSPDSVRTDRLNEELFGFAIVTEEDSKLVPISDSSRIEISTNTFSDALLDRLNGNTLSQFGQLATSLQRSQQPIFDENQFELNSTYNNAVYFKLDSLVRSLENPVFGSVFFAMKEQDSLLASSLPQNHVRPPLNDTRFFITLDSLIEESLVNDSNLGFVISRNNDVDRLQIGIKNTVDRILIDTTLSANFNLILGSNNGILKTNLYYSASSDVFKPTLFISNLEP